MVLDKATTRYVSLMLTYSCNLNCSYCYERFKSSSTMSIDMAKKQIVQIFNETLKQGKYKALEISFMGGEPLLEFEKIKLLSEWCWQQEWGIPYILFASTNGTLLTSEMKEWFYKNRDKIVLGISLDGTLSMQAINRGDMASKIDIDYFLNTWPLQGIKMTISKETLPYLYEGVIFLHEKGFQQIYANLAYGINWNDADLKIYKEQLLMLVEYYALHADLKPCSLLSLNLTEIIDLSYSYTKHCGCGEGTSLINVDGKTYPCPVFSPSTMSHELLEGLEDIDFTDVLAFVPQKCRQCVLHRACPKCYGMNYLHTGKIDSFNEFNCRAFKIQVLANCILQQELLKYKAIEDKEKLLASLHLLNLIL